MNESRMLVADADHPTARVLGSAADGAACREPFEAYSLPRTLGDGVGSKHSAPEPSGTRRPRAGPQHADLQRVLNLAVP